MRAKLVDLGFSLTIFLLLLLGYKYGNLQEILWEFIAFISGDVDLVGKNGFTALSDFWGALGILGADMLITIVIFNMIIFLFTIPNKIIKSSIASEEFGESLVFVLFVFAMAVLEEVIFRWLPLDLLAGLSFLSGKTAFYIILVGSCFLFAFFHLFNYEKELRHFLLVLPQFIGGFFFAFIFIKYNLLMAILIHFLFNMVSFVYLSARGDEVELKKSV